MMATRWTRLDTRCSVEGCRYRFWCPGYVEDTPSQMMLGALGLGDIVYGQCGALGVMSLDVFTLGG